MLKLFQIKGRKIFIKSSSVNIIPNSHYMHKGLAQQEKPAETTKQSQNVTKGTGRPEQDVQLLTNSKQSNSTTLPRKVK